MSRMAFLTRVLAFSQVVPPSLSSAGAAPPRVLLDEIEPFERDEQLVVAGVAELHELLRRLARAVTASRFRPTNRPMPLSTCTTRSPIFRSRKSDRNVRRRRSPALVHAAFLLEEIGLGEDAAAFAARQMEAARELAGRDEHGGARGDRRPSPTRRARTS